MVVRPPSYPCVSCVCEQTHTSQNGSFSKPQYSIINFLIRKFNHGDENDTFFGKFKDCDGQEMGAL